MFGSYFCQEKWKVPLNNVRAFSSDPLNFRLHEIFDILLNTKIAQNFSSYSYSSSALFFKWDGIQLCLKYY